MRLSVTGRLVETKCKYSPAPLLKPDQGKWARCALFRELRLKSDLRWKPAKAAVAGRALLLPSR